MCTQVVYTEVLQWSALVLIISAGLMGKIRSGFHRNFLESGEVRTHFLLLVQVDTEHGTQRSPCECSWRRLRLSQTQRSCWCQGVEALCDLDVKGKEGQDRAGPGTAGQGRAGQTFQDIWI